MSHSDKIKINRYLRNNIKLTGSNVNYRFNGKNLYVLDGSLAMIFQYSLTTPWDITTCVFNQSIDISGAMNAPGDIYIQADGTKVYMSENVAGATSDTDAYEFILNTAHDLSTIQFNRTVDLGVGNPNLVDITAYSFSPNGDYLFITDDNEDSIFSYQLNTKFDISDFTYLSERSIATPGHSSPHDLFIKDDGLTMYVADEYINAIREYTLSTAWDIGSVTNEDQTPVNNLAAYSGLFFKPDGTRMYMYDQINNIVHSYSLSTAWDSTTLSPLNSFDMSNRISKGNSISF